MSNTNNGASNMSLIVLNANEKTFYSRRSFVLWFGACAPTQILVYAKSLDSALDECVDWIVDNAPGLLADEQVHDAYKALIAEGKSEEQAQEEAEADTTTAGNCGNYLLSYEWGIVVENPSKQELIQIARSA